ncbi:hypothetical protein [Mycobacterium riyadhense]|uniref:hypothetical protein n=1 Tax=Mycobacterium riyadhense TaxID=486698 RepID=UPI00195C6CB2|nr:hypothetical protein [Mycobacterium riyadhense]
MPDENIVAGPDRELRMVVTSLQRLVLRVESRFNPDVTEGADIGDDSAADDELLGYARRCLDVLDDPAVTARLTSGRTSRW